MNDNKNNLKPETSKYLNKECIIYFDKGQPKPWKYTGIVIAVNSNFLTINDIKDGIKDIAVSRIYEIIIKEEKK